MNQHFIDNYLQELQHSLNNEINTLDNTNDVVEFKNKIFQIIYSFNKINDNLKNLIIASEHKLEKLCNHEWKRDNTYYGEHTQFYCSICHIYK